MSGPEDTVAAVLEGPVTGRPEPGPHRVTGRGADTIAQLWGEENFYCEFSARRRGDAQTPPRPGFRLWGDPQGLQLRVSLDSAPQGFWPEVPVASVLVALWGKELRAHTCPSEVMSTRVACKWGPLGFRSPWRQDRTSVSWFCGSTADPQASTVLRTLGGGATSRQGSGLRSPLPGHGRVC